MCGIVGVSGWTNEATLTEMLDSLHHRGPDDEGQFVDEDANVMLGARRLSILDISDGAQPMRSEDGSVVVVCNGEIYNHQSLRTWLRNEGHRFTSSCDTEVIVHLWEEVGEALVNHLDGMFVFALWDRDAETLVLARDRIGIKPLYYSRTDEGLIWGSEIPALLAAGVDRELDPRAVYNFFRLEYTPSPQTLLANVRKLPPGSIAVATADSFDIRRYWSLPTDGAPSAESIDAAARELRQLLEDSVERRLMADVPVGAFLSGGLDSTTIVGLMTEQKPDLETFAVRFPGKEYDESAEARFAAEYFGTTHHEVDVGLDSLEHLEMLVSNLSEPPSHTQFLPIYALSELTRDQGIKVALSGGGADELFCGYSRYSAVTRSRRKAPDLPDIAHDLAERVAPVAPFRRDMLAYFASLKDDETVLRRLNCGFGLSNQPEQLLEAQIDDETSGLNDAIDEAMDRTLFDDSAHLMTTYDLQYMLPDYVLYMADQTSMAASLEVRVPFLDHRIVEFAHRLPSEYKLAGSPKAVLKRATADLVPERIRSREKHGMGIPQEEWFRSDHEAVARWLTESKLAETPFLDTNTVLERWAVHRQGRGDYGRSLWIALSFVAWYHTLLTPKPERMEPA
ncbi:asparagine synthase (glutamine-hydrolyzing) [Halobacteriales archaeon SW_6_65_15]|jgi:asparagine synthase (glutamine-hydrolysing)|nr:MAG: asparagine synthase (glutamine-hydrolyzing) [Halobacteriales archaeon SW_6_65_15]